MCSDGVEEDIPGKESRWRSRMERVEARVKRECVPSEQMKGGQKGARVVPLWNGRGHSWVLPVVCNIKYTGFRKYRFWPFLTITLF